MSAYELIVSRQTLKCGSVRYKVERNSDQVKSTMIYTDISVLNKDELVEIREMFEAAEEFEICKEIQEHINNKPCKQSD